MVFDKATLATLVINFPLFLIIYHGAGVALAVAADVENAASATADNRMENVTVFLKSWPFRLVQKECESAFLYDYGYTSVLVSSIQDKTSMKGPDENFQFDDLFKFRTTLGTIEEFSSMIKSCEKNGIKVYLSLKLITDKQIDQVIKRYEEIEPFLFSKLAQRKAKAKNPAAKGATNKASPVEYLSKKADITDHTPAISHDIEKAPKKPIRFDENFMTQRQLKNTKYLMELVLLNAASNTTHDKAISSLMQSFKQVNTQYKIRYKRNEILSENSPIPGLVRKYCKLKYKLEDISSAIKFLRFLAELGVSGVRIENARYIDAGALNEIFTSAQKEIPRKMTLIFDDVVNVKHYQKFGSVMDEKYARNLMNAVKAADFIKLVSASKRKIWPQTWSNIASSGQCRPFVPKYMLPENDKDDSHNFKIATAMMLVNPYGFPMIISPYSRLKNRIKSLPNANEMKMEEICSRGKFCIHRKKFIRQLVLFRLITADKKITSIRIVQNNLLYLNRGNKGFAAFIHQSPPDKDEPTPENLTIQTELPPGLYCNITTGYAGLKRGQCDTSSVIQVDMKRRIFIKNVDTYRKGVIAIDILSRLKYMDIEASGKYNFGSNPSSKLLRNKGQITGSNYKPRDLDDLQEQQTEPTPAISPTTTIPSTAMQVRDVDIKFDFGGIHKIVTKPLKLIQHIVENIIDFVDDLLKFRRKRHKFPKYTVEHNGYYRWK